MKRYVLYVAHGQGLTKNSFALNTDDDLDYLIRIGSKIIDNGNGWNSMCWIISNDTGNVVWDRDLPISNHEEN